MNWKSFARGIVFVLLGMLGMGLFQVGACAYKDLRFLHIARLQVEAQQAAAQAQPPGK